MTATEADAIAVDTSVAVPLLLAAHEHHSAVAAWARGRRLAVSGHALAETYSVLTRLPGEARVAPVDAVALIDARFPMKLAPSPETSAGFHQLCADRGIAGGAVYDALVAVAARDNDVVLATMDARARGTYDRVGVATTLIGP